MWIVELAWLLTKLSADLGKRQSAEPESFSAHTPHTKIAGLIGRALALNKITSSQAERYHARLAEIESNLETLRAAPSPQPGEVAAEKQSSVKLNEELQASSCRNTH